MTGFTVKMLVSYRKWRETAERMGWGTSPANHGQKVNPAEDTSDTIRERIASNCPWYYTLEEILHGGDLEAREPGNLSLGPKFTALTYGARGGVEERIESSDAYGKTGLGRALPGPTGAQHTAIPPPPDLPNRADSHVDSNRDERSGPSISYGATGFGTGHGFTRTRHPAEFRYSDLASKDDSPIDSYREERSGSSGESHNAGLGKRSTTAYNFVENLSKTRPYSSGLSNKGDLRADSDRDMKYPFENPDATYASANVSKPILERIIAPPSISSLSEAVMTDAPTQNMDGIAETQAQALPQTSSPARSPDRGSAFRGRGYPRGRERGWSSGRGQGCGRGRGRGRRRGSEPESRSRSGSGSRSERGRVRGQGRGRGGRPRARRGLSDINRTTATAATRMDGVTDNLIGFGSSSPSPLSSSFGSL